MRYWKLLLCVVLCSFVVIAQGAQRPGWYVHEEETVYQARGVVGNGDYLDIYCVQDLHNEIGIIFTSQQLGERQFGTDRGTLAGIIVDGREYISPDRSKSKGAADHFYALMNILRTAHTVSIEVIDHNRRYTIPIPVSNLSAVLPPDDAELKARCPVDY